MSSHEIPHPVSRREFARRAAVATAAVAAAIAVPQEIRAQGASTAVSDAPEQPPMTPEVAAEVEAKYNEVLRLDGPKFSVAQKQEVHNQLIGQVKGLQKLRAYALDNADAPATVLRLNATEGKRS